jgi:hypothetical protein
MFLPHSNRIAIIARPKLGEVSDEHWGVYVPARDFVIHLLPQGVQVTNLVGFKQGQEHRVVQEIRENGAFGVFQRINEARMAGSQYRYVDWNCQHFANWIAGEEATSPSVKKWAVAAAVAGVAIAVIARL